MGSVVVEDVGASPWGIAWVMFAAAAGSGLVAAAASLFKRPGDGDEGEGEFAGGYNALAAIIDRH